MEHLHRLELVGRPDRDGQGVDRPDADAPHLAAHRGFSAYRGTIVGDGQWKQIVDEDRHDALVATLAPRKLKPRKGRDLSTGGDIDRARPAIARPSSSTTRSVRQRRIGHTSPTAMPPIPSTFEEPVET